MSNNGMKAGEILDREFLEIRAKVIELAASFDRLDRADGSVADDARLGKIQEGLEILLGAEGERAEQIQLLFSRTYDDDWRDRFNMPT